MRASGEQLRWFGDADEGVLAVSGQSNGRLLEVLLVAAGYYDVECVELLKGESIRVCTVVCILPPCSFGA